MEATAPSPAPTPSAETENPASAEKPEAGKSHSADSDDGKPTPEKADGQEKKAEKKEGEKPAPKRYRLPKDDGTEEEVDEAEAKRRYSHAREANKRMEEAAKVRKQAEAFIEKFLDDPMAILDNPNVAQKLKKPLRQMLEERLAVDLRKEIDPEKWQREQEDAETKRAAQAWKEHQEGLKRQEEERELSALQQRYEQEYDHKLKAVLDGAGLPRTTNVVRRAAQLMQVAIKQGYEPDLGMIVDQVRDEYQGDTKSLYSTMTGDQLIAFFGEEIANKIRKADLARLRKPAEAKEAAKEPVDRKPREAKKLNPRDFFADAMKRAGV